MRAYFVLFAFLIGCNHALPRVEEPIARSNADEVVELVPLDTTLGRSMLERNLEDADAIPLLRHFESQRHLARCGIASSVVALNALGFEAAPNPLLGAYRYFTQEALVADEATASVLPATTIDTEGLTLDQLGAILEAHGARVHVVHGAATNLEAFRALVRENVSREGDVVLINYSRPALGQTGGGHISPIAAYDELTDRALVLDVARYRYAPAFIRLETLYNATLAIDSSSGLSRGLVEVSKERSSSEN